MPSSRIILRHMRYSVEKRRGNSFNAGKRVP
jgi:hypothetical protein